MGILEQVREHRIITILRGVPWERAADTAEALYQGGIRLLEITFDQSSPRRIQETSRAIRSVRERMGERMTVGAGTVLTEEEAAAACESGASFLLAPNTDGRVVRRGKALGMGVIPGAFTPTEIAEAWRLGADLVKVFPAGSLGTGYLKAVRAPLSQIPLLAVGGIGRGNLREFLAAADGVGIGSKIADLNLIRQGRYSELAGLARGYTELL